jgi:DNA-binding transcriptional regulator of glucitol operon
MADSKLPGRDWIWAKELTLARFDSGLMGEMRFQRVEDRLSVMSVEGCQMSVRLPGHFDCVSHSALHGASMLVHGGGR